MKKILKLKFEIFLYFPHHNKTYVIENDEYTLKMKIINVFY